jgi:hypothetical protein
VVLVLSDAPSSPLASVAVEKARLAALTRHHPHGSDAVADARQRVRAARAEAEIRRLVLADPPLTIPQRAHLAALLLGGADAAP